MRKLNGFILGCTFALLAGTASAQIDIEFVSDGEILGSIPAGDIETILVLTNTNKVQVVVKVPYTIEPAGDPCSEGCGDPTPAVINSFTSTPSTTTITEGEFTTLTWSTTDAVSCSLSASPLLNLGAVSTSSNGFDVTINTAAVYTITLTCQGTDSADVTDTTVVTVEQAGDPDQNSTCEGFIPPLGDGVNVKWENSWPSPFPGPENIYDSIYVPYSSYLSMEFNTGNVIDSGKITNTESTRTGGLKFATISECRGDFTVTEKYCKIKWGLGGSLKWSTGGSRSDACQLEQNTRYYVNFTFTDGEDSGSSTCDGTPCEIILRHYNK